MDFNVLFPLYWSYKTKTENIKVLFPIVWKLKNEKYSSFTFFPLYSAGKAADSSLQHLAITPLYWRFKTPNGTKSTIFPVFWNFKSGSGEYEKYFSVIFPVYWSYRDKDKTTKILFPLFWSNKYQGYSSFTFFPVFSYRHSSDNLYRKLNVALLFRHSETPFEKRNVLFPIYWNKKEMNGYSTKTTHVLFPVYWSYKDSLKNNKVLFPVLWRFKNPEFRSFSLIPIASWGKAADSSFSYWAATPLFWHIKNSNSRINILFPLYWNKKSGHGEYTERTNVLFPIYWAYHDHYKSNHVIFPVIWSLKNTRYKSFSFLPLLSVGKSADSLQNHLMITPFFWHTRNDYNSRNILFPIFWNSKRGKGQYQEKRSVLFPVYWSYKDNLKNNKVLFPIIWNMKDTNHKSFTLFPLLSFGKSITEAHNNYLAVTPLFWNVNKPQSHRSILFPVFNYYTKDDSKRFDILLMLYRYSKTVDKKQISVLWPIINFSRDTQYVKFRVAPVIWYKSSVNSTSFSIQPLYYQNKTNESNQYQIFWQLFTYKNTFDVKKSRNFLWRAAFLDTYKNGDYEFRFLHLLLAIVNKEGSKERSLFPLFYSTKNENGNKSFSCLLYFYHSFKRKLPDSNKFYQEERIFWFIRLRSNYNKLKSEGLLK